MNANLQRQIGHEEFFFLFSSQFPRLFAFRIETQVDRGAIAPMKIVRFLSLAGLLAAGPLLMAQHQQEQQQTAQQVKAGPAPEAKAAPAATSKAAAKAVKADQQLAMQLL